MKIFNLNSVMLTHKMTSTLYINKINGMFSQDVCIEVRDTWPK